LATLDERVRSCRLCGDLFVAEDLRQAYCSPICSRVGADLQRSAHEGEEIHVTRDLALAESFAHAYRERGCRRVGRKSNPVATRGAYLITWQRGPLFLIRARLPEAFREEESEAA
jgi:hypothetical protein